MNIIDRVSNPKWVGDFEAYWRWAIIYRMDRIVPVGYWEEQKERQKAIWEREFLLMGEGK